MLFVAGMAVWYLGSMVSSEAMPKVQKHEAQETEAIPTQTWTAIDWLEAPCKTLANATSLYPDVTNFEGGSGRTA